MKNFLTAAIITLTTASEAAVLQLYNRVNCNCGYTTRNVYDNTCAYPGGFQSAKIVTGGGQYQLLTFWSPQACAGKVITTNCAAGVNAYPLNQCFSTANGSGGSNAVSSYSGGATCPN